MDKDVWSVVQDLSYLTCPSCICNPMLKDIPFDRNESCESVVMRGVLTIESLAAERDSLAERCRQLEARNDALIAKEVLFDEAIAAGAKMQRERDAAVEELSYSRKCSICKKHLSEGGDCYGNHKCGNGNPDWQWRGVKEDNHAGIH